jgi:GntR family frlABCD operon transcriptional regulator
MLDIVRNIVYDKLVHLSAQVYKFIGITKMSLNTKLLNRQSHIALYYQLKHILLSQINEGVYKEGDRLPSESELSQQYEVSRHVVRQALKALIAEGRIIAYQGAGYFVNQKRIRKALPRLGSHTKSMASLGSPTQTLVVRQEVI